MSHHPSPRPGRARRAALVLAAVVALGACSHNRQVPTDYGDTTRDNFTEGCEEALTDRDGEGTEAFSDSDATAICECSYEAISDEQDGIPFEEFKETYEALEEEPGPLPEDIRAMIDACRAEVAPA
jgi:hypothetical protein